MILRRICINKNLFEMNESNRLVLSDLTFYIMQIKSQISQLIKKSIIKMNESNCLIFKKSFFSSHANIIPNKITKTKLNPRF